MNTKPTKLRISYEVYRKDGFEEHQYDPMCDNGHGGTLIVDAMRLGWVCEYKVVDISPEEPGTIMNESFLGPMPPRGLLVKLSNLGLKPMSLPELQTLLRDAQWVLSKLDNCLMDEQRAELKAALLTPEAEECMNSIYDRLTKAAAACDTHVPIVANPETKL
jgi:hypothetical protein